MSNVRYDLPTPDADTVAFWEAAKEGRLLIKRCSDCGMFHYYPRPFCPHCWSRKVEWYQASGQATLYSWSVIYQNDQPVFRDRVPYIAAIVDLAEGPRMMTNVVGVPFDQLHVGMSLSLRFMPISDEYVVPVFGPGPSQASQLGSESQGR